MPRILNINSYSLNVKVTFSLFILATFLLSILFLLIVPKMQKEEYIYAKQQTEQMISLTKEQINIAGKAIYMQSKLETATTKLTIEKELNRLKYLFESKPYNLNEFIKNEIKNNRLNNDCILILKNKKKELIYTTKNISFNFNHLALNKWQEHHIEDKISAFNKKEKLLSYTIKINKQLLLSTMCKTYTFNKNHSSFEETLKINVQKAFSLTNNIHQGKIYIMWLNRKYENQNSQLYTQHKNKIGEKYSISNMSNVTNISTGKLSAKQIVKAINNGPVKHILNDKEAMTWIVQLSKSDLYYSLLVMTAYEKDFDNNIDSAFWKILPAALIALFLVILAGFFLFKRLFKGINILTNTAKEVNHGNKKIRSKVKGNDDIGNLGIAFDSMLNSFENNIKTLDSKVDEKTKELKDSLEEKEILLKEIHHRVKNNLALTISLIKLQQVKVKDKKSKDILNNIQERIYTMELLHRKLYESSNLNSIPFKEYVTNLTIDISQAYEYDKELEIKIDMKETYLNIEKAMPCGLILNEIITNSFKYGFVENENPKLFISMIEADKKYTLTIKDNGKGIPSDIDIYNSNSLGLKLISSISKLQLSGKFEYYYEEGAVFKIKF